MWDSAPGRELDLVELMRSEKIQTLKDILSAFVAAQTLEAGEQQDVEASVEDGDQQDVQASGAEDGHEQVVPDLADEQDVQASAMYGDDDDMDNQSSDGAQDMEARMC